MQDLINSSDQLVDFFNEMRKFIWETGELLLDIVLEFCHCSFELVLTVLNLGLGVLCYFRDCCIDSVQTFSNTICGIIKLLGCIDCEDVEDFAAACFVFILWIAAGKFLLNIIEKTKERYNPKQMLVRLLQATLDDKIQQPISCSELEEDTWLYQPSPSRKKTTGNRTRRSSKRR